MKKNFMRFLAGFIYSSLIIFSLPVSSHDMLGSAESNEKSEWEVSCKDYVEVTKSGIYTAKTTIAALAYHWKLPKAEFEKHFLRDDSGQLRYDDSNIKPYATNPTPNQFICDNRNSRNEMQTIITEPISYWKLTCNPRTLMTTTKNDDHLVALLNNTVGDSGPQDPDIWKTYVQGLFDYNYETINGFVCPNNDFIRLILWPYDKKNQAEKIGKVSKEKKVKEKAVIDKEIEKINNQNQIIKQRLKNLKELFEEELINEQEYNQKKQEILDQL